MSNWGVKQMTGYVLLASGDTYEGKWIGNANETYGEVIFYTGMAGYEEVLTDPSYRGCFVVFAYPLIGNCGINFTNIESSDIQVSGIILSNYSERAYHYEAKETFINYLEHHEVPTLVNVDTRSLIKKLREIGNVPGVMAPSLPTLDKSKLTAFEARPLIDEVVTPNRVLATEGETHVVLIDYGYKRSLLDVLKEYNCKVSVVPYTISLQKLTKLRPDGVLFSNGPGNPKQLLPHVKKNRTISEQYPTLGIGLGHQLLALAHGAEINKMKIGHYGVNYPVIHLQSNKVFITDQSHRYSVCEESLRTTPFSVSFRNINDGSLEGLVHNTLPIYTVQFNLKMDQGVGENDSIFHRFLNVMRNVKGEHIYA